MSIKESNFDRYRFRLTLLHPRYWLTWIGLAVYFVFTLLPMSVIVYVGVWLGSAAAGNNNIGFYLVCPNLS